MIISGESIKEAVKSGTIKIDPYVEENVQPASIDLTLGEEVRVYSSQVIEHTGRDLDRPGEALVHDVYQPLDPKKALQTTKFKMTDEGFVIKPGILYLMHTHERICSTTMVSVLDGKSSIGRLGVVVHLTAGYGDPGFDGQYTLEVTCIHPVILYPGMKIAQMRFHVMYGEVNTSYATRGHYVGDKAEGAIPSMAHKQF